MWRVEYKTFRGWRTVGDAEGEEEVRDLYTNLTRWNLGLFRVVNPHNFIVLPAPENSDE